MDASFANPNSDSGLKVKEPLVLGEDMKGKSPEEISKLICNTDLKTLLGSLKVPRKNWCLNEEPFRSVLDHLKGKSEQDFSEMMGYEHLSNLPKLYNFARNLGLDTLTCALISHLETEKSMEELSEILLKGGELMTLIKLIELSFQGSGPSQLFSKCTTHIEGKSNEELKEAILNLHLKDLIHIVKICECREERMVELLKVVVDHLVNKSREDLSKMVKLSKSCGEEKRLLDEAEKALHVYQLKANKAPNDKFLEKWKSLFKAVVFPKLEDEGLIRFGIACKGASKFVASEISSRYISLRRNEIPLQVNDVEIKLENNFGFSVNVSLGGSLQSGILCAERVKNIETYGRERSFTRYMDRMEDQLLEIASGYCEAASSEDANALAIWAVNLENVGNRTLLNVAQPAQVLEMKGLLLKAAEYMAQRLRGITQESEMRQTLGFPPEADPFDFGDSLTSVSVEENRPFLELMIPMLDNQSYLCFAEMDKACAFLVNEVQPRKCYRAGQQVDPWNISLSCTKGETFMASEALISLSGLIKKKQLEIPLEDNFKIDLQHTGEEALRMISKYCAKHATDNVSEVKLRTWDAKFLRGHDASNLLALAQAALEMGIKSLVDLVSQRLASLINHKTVQEIRASFPLKEDVTSYAESKWRHKYEWAFVSDPLSPPAVGVEIPMSPSNPTLTEEDLIAHLPESEKNRWRNLMSFTGKDPEEE